MLLNESIKEFIHYLVTTDKSNETVRSYKRDLVNFERFIEQRYNGSLYLEEIKSSDIEEYLYYLKMKNLQTASRSRNLYTLRSFWKYAYKNKLCQWNIVMEVEPIKIQRKERTYLTMEEVNKLIETINHPLIKIVIETLFYTGMRISECLNLKLQDVNFQDKVIYVIEGKGKKDRNIPINKNIIPILKSYIENERPKVDSEYFFATKKSGRLSAPYVNRILNDTVKELGWKKHVSAHILRHSFASNLIKKGVNLVYVQKLLGHSNLKVTSIYTHADMEDLQESVNTLQNIEKVE